MRMSSAAARSSTRADESVHPGGDVVVGVGFERTTGEKAVVVGSRSGSTTGTVAPNSSPGVVVVGEVLDDGLGSSVAVVPGPARPNAQPMNSATTAAAIPVAISRRRSVDSGPSLTGIGGVNVTLLSSAGLARSIGRSVPGSASSGTITGGGWSPPRPQRRRPAASSREVSSISIRSEPRPSSTTLHLTTRRPVGPIAGSTVCPVGIERDDTLAVVTEYLSALSSHDVDRIVGCVSDDFVNQHTSALATSSEGRESYRTRLPHFLAEFESLRYDVLETIVEGDRAAVRYRMTAVYDGRAIALPGVMIFHVAGGHISSRLDVWDSLTFLRQAGLANAE